MPKIRYILSTAVGLFLLASVVYGATVLFPYQGGTGTGTLPVQNEILQGDGTGGYLLTDSPTFNNLGVTGTASTTKLHLSTVYSETGDEAVGDIWWDSANGTVSVTMDDGITGQIFEEMWFEAKNQTGSTIDNCTPVMFAGVLGASGMPLIQKAIGDDSIPPQYIMGLVTNPNGIANGDTGKVTWFGKVRGCQTDGANYSQTWSDGDLAYVSTSTPGYLTNVQPNAPNRNILVAAVMNAHATNGTFLVRPSWNPKLTDLDDVDGNAPVQDYIIAYDGVNGYWTPTSTANLSGDITSGGFYYGDGSKLTLKRIGNSTYSTVQDLQNIFHSAGWVSGGTITDAGGLTFNVAAGTGLIRDTNSSTADTYYFDWNASSTIAMIGDRVYVGVEYNGGSPRVSVRTTNTFNSKTDFILGTVTKPDGSLHIENDPLAVGDHAANMINRLYQANGCQRDNITGGIIIGETGTRNVTLSAGALWCGLTRFSIPALDTSVTGTFESWYYNGTSWVDSDDTQWDNTNYNDTSSGLVALSAGRYTNRWFYISTDGDVIMIYGQAQHNTLAQAEAASPPSSVPSNVSVQSKLIGRFIIRQGGATTEEIQTIFDTVFNSTAASIHNNLGGLQGGTSGEYYHFTSAEHTELNGWLPNIVLNSDGSIDDLIINNSLGSASNPVPEIYATTGNYAYLNISNYVDDAAITIGSSTIPTVINIITTNNAGSGTISWNNGFTVDNNWNITGYASSTVGFFTQGNGHYGGNLTVDGNATTSGQIYTPSIRTGEITNYYGSACSAGDYISDIADNGTFSCSTPDSGAGGSGTGNKVAKWTGIGASTTLGDSLITDTGPAVGINQSSPNYTLDVNGDTNISGDLRLNTYQFANYASNVFKVGDIGGTPTAELQFYSNGSQNMTLDTSGRLGVNDTTPSYTLDIGGQAQIQSTSNPGLIVGNGSTGYIKVGGSTISDAAGDLTLNSDSGEVYIPDEVGIGTNAPAYPLDVVGNGRIRSNLYIGTNGAYIYNDTSTRLNFPYDIYLNGTNNYMGSATGDNFYYRGSVVNIGANASTQGASTGGLVVTNYTADTGSDGIRFYEGATQVGEIGVTDTTYLRLCQITSGCVVYTPRQLRTDGQLAVGTSPSALNSEGLTVNQGSADDEIFTLQSSDVAHGMTLLTDTDTFMYIKKTDAAAGAASIWGFSESGNSSAFNMVGVAGSGYTGQSTSAIAPFWLLAYKKSGTAATAVGTGENVATFGQGATTRFILRGDGTGYADVTWTTFSDGRFKENIEPIQYGLDDLLKLEPKKYTHYSGTFDEDGNPIKKSLDHYEKDGEEIILPTYMELSDEEKVGWKPVYVDEVGREEIGFIAQEVYEVIPEAVTKPEDESISKWALTKDVIVPVIVKAIQQMWEVITNHSDRIVALEAQNKALEARLEALEGKTINMCLYEI